MEPDVSKDELNCRFFTAEEKQWSLEMLKSSVNIRRSICEVLRETYQVLKTLPESSQKSVMTDKLVEAQLMAKRMSAKLTEYKATWEDHFYPVNDDYERDKIARSA